MKKMIVLGMLLLSVLVIGCTQEVIDGEYMAGEVLVGFHEGMDKITAQEIIDSYGLEIDSWSPRYFTIINVAVNEGDISVIELHEGIGYLTQIEGNEYTVYFHIEDSINLRLEEVEEILSKFDVEIIEDDHYNEVMSVERATLLVPIGEEVEWVNILQEDENFRYVELNYLVEIDI
jgi:hypothetical protein